MKLRKITSSVSALVLCLSILTACTESSTTSSKADTSSAAETTQTTTTAESQAESESQSSSSADSSQTDSTTPSDMTPAMWTVTSPDGQTMTLMGSMHALKDTDYPLPDKVMELYNSADVLAVECDTVEYQKDLFSQLKLAKQMLYDDGTTLKSVLSDEAYTAISDYLETCGTNISIYESYKPWAFSSVLDSFSITSSGLNATKGLDSYLLQQAHSTSKEIYEVESIDFQMNLLMNMSDDIYDMIFSSYEGQTIDTQSQALLDLYNAWRTGDTDRILEDSTDITPDGEQAMTDEQLATYNDYENQLLYERNIGMVEAVKNLLSEKKNVFYVVGVAHFVGDKGIISLLEKDGYTVERIEY